MSVRDRFFTRGVLRALTSPWSIGVAVVVAVGAALLGAPLLAAIGVGAAVYVAPTVLAMVKPTAGGGASGRGRRSSGRIDPFVLSEPWRRHVQSALSAKGRFDRAVRATSSGPIKDRLTELAARLDLAVDQSWQIARKGDEIDHARSQLTPSRSQDALARRQAEPESADRDAAIASLEATLAAAARMDALSTRASQQLSLLDTQLDELVARAAEVGVGAGDGMQLSGQVDDLVGALEGLRLAMEDGELTVQSPAPGIEPTPTSAPASSPPDDEQPRPQTWPPT